MVSLPQSKYHFQGREASLGILSWEEIWNPGVHQDRDTCKAALEKACLPVKPSFREAVCSISGHFKGCHTLLQKELSEFSSVCNDLNLELSE